ncbi:exported hypothetical protein [Candidatus Desulfosporosinus infrequens]|uniref:Uncharacterized protein n=1 Tax=Candidatus Desulfosporosinus infrequens TaxID=2043169 RepID=A0A2U3KVY5_9FIRM|nr:exported hypothetical protein [Candidatus Desulfosporosinus infrequens]
MMKYILIYLFVMAIILIFNYGAHSGERMENELQECDVDSTQKKKSLSRTDEHTYSGRITHGTI